MRIPANNPKGTFKIGDNWIAASKQMEVTFPPIRDVNLKFEMGNKNALQLKIDTLLNVQAGNAYRLHS